MAYEIPGFSFTLVAGQTFAEKQFRAVKVHGSGRAIIPGAGDAIVGIAQDNVVSGEALAIMNNGISKWVAGEALTAGENVATDAAGEAVEAATGDFGVGTVLESVASGDVATVLLHPVGQLV